MRIRVRRRVFIILMIAWAVGSALPSHAQDNAAKLTIVPSEGSSTDQGGSYFLIDAEPGDKIRQSVDVRNAGKRPITVRIAGVDADTAVAGGADYDLSEEPDDAVGAWITLSEEEVRLRPGEQKRLAFTLDVPRDVGPGVHLGGLSADIVAAAAGTPSPQETTGGTQVIIESRRVVAVQVNLPGTAEPKIVIEDVQPVFRTTRMDLEIVMSNVGTGFAKGEGVIELPDDGFEEPLRLETFVPGTTIRFPVTWMEAPDAGEYRVTVRLNYGKDLELMPGLATYEGTFVIGEEDASNLGGGSKGDLPWGLIALGGLALLGIAAYLLWRRRRRTASNPPGHAPQPAPRPAPAPAPAPQQGYTGGYTGSAEGTFGSGARPQKQPAPQTPQQRPPGTPPPPPPPPPKKGP